MQAGSQYTAESSLPPPTTVCGSPQDLTTAEGDQLALVLSGSAGAALVVNYFSFHPYCMYGFN